MAVGTLLSGVLPLSDYGDGKLFDAGALYILALAVPAGLLVLAAATCSNKAQMAGLGGGASIGVASLVGAMAILLWKSGGDNLGVGTYVLTATAVLGVITFLVSLGVPVAAVRTPAHWLAAVAAFAMSLGCTLVPSDRGYRISWADYNGFGQGRDQLIAFAYQVLIWMPLIAVLIGAVKGGRFGAMFGFGGSLILAWFVFASTVEIGSDGFSRTFALSSDVHPVGIAGAVAVIVLTLVASAMSPAPAAPSASFGATHVPLDGVVGGANPGRWADDPFGRHASRYWNGTVWTDQVANNGVTSIDPAVAHPAPPVVAAPPTAPPPPAAPAPGVPGPSPFAAQPAPSVPHASAPGLLPMSFDGATVPRIAPSERASTPMAELVLDTGQRVVLVGTLVIGRAPRVQPSEPTATLLVVDDSTMSMSATHLMVGPAPGGAWVQDIGSTNGSSIVDPNGLTTELAPGARAIAVVGSVIHFGDRNARLISSETK